MLEGHVRVIHPGIHLTKFENNKKGEIRRKIRAQYGVSSQDTVILFVGMNFEIKRLDLILKAMAVLNKEASRAPDLKLLIVGKGNYKKFKRLANQLQIADRVIFAGPSEEVENFYFAGDLFAMPSTFDTFGMVVLEAMAAGLPPIIAKTVGASDLVEDGVHGFVLERDPSILDMAGALKRLLDPVTRGLMAENARRQASAETWDCRARQVGKIYRQILDEKSLSK